MQLFDHHKSQNSYSQSIEQLKCFTVVHLRIVQIRIQNLSLQKTDKQDGFEYYCTFSH